jgi:hypothetical protein
MWLQLLAILAGGLLVFVLYQTIRGNPSAFSVSNLNKSARTLGILALLLIGFITLCIFFVRQ